MKDCLFRIVGLVLCLAFGLSSNARSEESPLKIFGYFQTEFHQEDDSGVASNSFLLQQLNLFLQKDLAKDWTSFVNVEIVNSYSSSRDWGSLNLEEAWVSYRSSDQFKMKLGLHIPEFNNLNTIKNRTPLLPYIIRPFPYETSFGEFFNLEIITPPRAYLSMYGTIPSGKLDIDHAFYVGNSPNVRTGEQARNGEDNSAPQSGTDTTGNFMIGGRVGIRYGSLKFGVSGTHERLNVFSGFEQLIGVPESHYEGMPLNRIGADLTYYWKDFVFESEIISSSVDREVVPGVDIKVNFYYATLGFYLNEYLFVYGTMSQLDIDDFAIDIIITPPADTTVNTLKTSTDVLLPYVGFSYQLNNRITFKGQMMLATIEEKWIDRVSLAEVYRNERDNNRFAIAVSVFF